MRKLFLLEDDLSLISGLTFAFKKQGFALDTARTLAEAEVLWSDRKYDLLVLAVGMVLLLPQQAHQALTVVELPLGGIVQIAGELHEYLHLAVLGQIKAQRTGGFFHSLRLCRAAHTGYGPVSYTHLTLPTTSRV